MSIEQAEVQLGARSYSVVIGKDVAVEPLSRTLRGASVLWVTDETVAGLPLARRALAAVRDFARQVVVATVPPGESSKSVTQLADLWSLAAQARLNRGCVVVAVGGGVVGDLAGMVAATYLRGVRLVQVPTTLLAAVDSSVGGKTGINLPEGKNLVGAFQQPEAVWVDLGFLESLPPRELAAGMAEVIKYGAIRDADFFAQLEVGPSEAWTGWIRRCVEIKAAIVAADEREVTGERALLNFGHTIGHAIEQASGYGRWLHGEAVAIGMVGAARFSQDLAGLPAEEVDRLIAVLKRYRLPVRLENLPVEQVWSALARDKKAADTGIRWVLLRRIGEAFLSDPIPEEPVRKLLLELGR